MRPTAGALLALAAAALGQGGERHLARRGSPAGTRALSLAAQTNRRVGRAQARRRGARAGAGDGPAGLEAVGQLPPSVIELFGQARLGLGSPGSALQALNEVFRRAQMTNDTLGLACTDRKGEARVLVEDARRRLAAAELSLTRHRGRILSLQRGIDRSLAEVETLREQFEEHRGLCKDNRERSLLALSLLGEDLPLATRLAGLVTRGCGPDGGTAPALVECSLPDGSFVVTFQDQALRDEVLKLSGRSERLLALHLDYALRGQAAAQRSAALLQTGRRLRVRGAAIPAVSTHRRPARPPPRRRRRPLLLVQRRQLVRRLPDYYCAAATALPCESFADHVAGFVGGVQDLADELRVLMGSEEEHCRKSLEAYTENIEDLKQQSDDASVALANAVAEQGGYESSRRARREQLSGARREAEGKEEECQDQLDQAQEAMSAAKRLVAELSSTGAAAVGAFLGDCEVSNWVEGACSQPCGAGGTQNVTRRVVKAPALQGGPCPELQVTRACNEKPCAVDGVTSEWQDWSDCSQACGGGTRTRSRRIVQEARYGGLPAGESMQEHLCNPYPCDQDCVVSEWSAWSNCTKACSGGHSTRVRHVLRQALGNGGCPAEDTPQRRQATVCNRQPCRAAPPLQCGSPLDLVFVLDASGSMGAAGFDAAKRFIQAAAARTLFGDGDTFRGIPPQARLGAVQFGSSATVLQELTPEHRDFAAGLGRALWQRTATNTGEAVATAADMLERGRRAGAQPVIAVVTDGMPLSSYIMSMEADRLRSRRGVRLVFVLVDPGLSRKPFRLWASWPKADNLLQVNSFDAFAEEGTVTALLATLCPRLE